MKTIHTLIKTGRLSGKRLSWRMERRSSSKGLWDLLPLDAGVFFTAGIADEEHGLSGIITED
jgi:hypothetical protein